MPKPNRVGLNLGALAASFEAKLTRFGAAVRTGGAKATEAQMRDVHRVIVLTAPVDTGRLRRSWPPPTARGSDLIWGTGTTLDYAPTLEYGGYRRVGPRTMEAGPGDLGAGFTVRVMSTTVRRVFDKIRDRFLLAAFGTLGHGDAPREAGLGR